MQASNTIRRGVKFCPKCNGEMGLVWKDRKRSENAYASERMHQLLCSNCGFSRTERFVDRLSYPIQINYDIQGRLTLIINEGDQLTRHIDAATIAGSE